MYRQHYPNDPGMHNMPSAYNSRASPYQQQPTVWERIRRSFVAVIVGVMILTVASGVLFWNEGRAVQTSQSLDEGLRSVRILTSNEVIFDENNGKLVHVTGPLRTTKALYDEDYSIAVPAIKLRRNVQMYQWVETEERREIHDGDQMTEDVSYRYNEEWRSDLIRSSSFNNRLHVNPDTIPVEAKMYLADDAQAGSFILAKSLIEKVTNFRELHTNDPPTDSNAKLYHGIYYHGNDPTRPQVGDVRVTFEYAGLSGRDSSRVGAPDVVSILARQSGHELTTYHTEAGDEIELLYMGEHTAEHMIGREHMTNSVLLWALRFVGWLLMFIGFGCLTSFLTTMVDSVPVIREVMALGAVSFSTTLSISLSLTIIAMGWIWYRPYLGLAILSAAVLPFVISRIRYQTTRAYRPV